MGKIKYLKLLEELFKKSPVVDANSILRIVKSKKNIKQYNKQLIRNLILNGKIKRITKGYYTIHDEPSLSVFCFKPAYLSLQDSLSFHNLWEQESIPIMITTKKVRQGIRKVFGVNVLIRRINKKYFFGFELCKDRKFYLPYSDIEKTFIDMIYFKEKLSDKALSEIKKRIDKKKLNSYLRKYPKRFRDRVLRVFVER